jgi:hypothetical protein
MAEKLGVAGVLSYFFFQIPVIYVRRKQLGVAHLLSKLQLLPKFLVATPGLFINLPTMMKRLDVNILAILIRFWMQWRK